MLLDESNTFSIVTAEVTLPIVSSFEAGEIIDGADTINYYGDKKVSIRVR
jgi:hypothetical protein